MMIISLFTVRVIFNVLGSEDYGIQNVVAGFVTMFAFVTGSVSTTISRFLSLGLSKKNQEEVQKVFSTSLVLLIIIACALIFFIELIGVPLLNFKMTIPEGRIIAANYVLQFSIITLFFSTISICYDSLIISYEKMSAYAYIGIIDAVLKLLVAYSLYISSFDKLILYSFLLSFQSILLRFIYAFYCRRNIPSIKFSLSFDKATFKKIVGLTGWDFLGAASMLLKNNAVDVVMNIFLGPVINAAKAIANQINSAVSKFSLGFLTAIRPQIFKAYGMGDMKYLQELVVNGTRVSAYLLLLPSIPIMFYADFIINVWLGSVPAHSSSFLSLILILAICDGSLVYCHNAALLAVGRIRDVQIITGFLQLSNIPLSYLFLYYGNPPEVTLIIAICISQICTFIRVYFLKKYIGYSIKIFFKEVYVKIHIVFFVSLLPIYILKNSFELSWYSFILVFISSALSTGIIILYLGCKGSERLLIKSKLKVFISKISNRT